jgi:hypothetical protein
MHLCNQCEHPPIAPMVLGERQAPSLSQRRPPLGAFRGHESDLRGERDRLIESDLQEKVQDPVSPCMNIGLAQ